SPSPSLRVIVPADDRASSSRGGILAHPPRRVTMVSTVYARSIVSQLQAFLTRHYPFGSTERERQGSLISPDLADLARLTWRNGRDDAVPAQRDESGVAALRASVPLADLGTGEGPGRPRDPGAWPTDGRRGAAGDGPGRRPALPGRSSGAE